MLWEVCLAQMSGNWHSYSRRLARCKRGRGTTTTLGNLSVDVSYAAPQAHEIVNVALQQEYSLGIVFIFFQGRKNLYHV
jgi:hypothetical protein